MSIILQNIKRLLINDARILTTHLDCSFHTSETMNKQWNGHNYGPRKWLEYNKTIFPPQKENEEPRPAVSIV